MQKVCENFKSLTSNLIPNLPPPRYILRRERQSNVALNLYGFITAKGVGRLFLFKTNTSESYLYNLEQYVLPAIRETVGDDFILQQDNCSVHMSDLCLRYFHQKQIKVLVWPARSPDWNLIEYCWSYLVSGVNKLIWKHGQPGKNQEALLFKLCERAWYSISSQTVKRLYEKLPILIDRYLKTGI